MTQEELFDLTVVALENNESRDEIAEKFGDTIADNAVQIFTNCGSGAIEFPTLTPDLDQVGNLIYRPVDEEETVKSVIDTVSEFGTVSVIDEIDDDIDDNDNHHTALKVTLGVIGGLAATAGAFFGIKKYKEKKAKKAAVSSDAVAENDDEKEVIE